MTIPGKMHPERLPEPQESRAASTPHAASAVLVNRTHRVIRERAAILQARRSTVRSLWIPLAVSGALLAVLVIALWNALEDYDPATSGFPDGNQMLVVLMWSVPLSAMLLAVVWFRRMRSDHGGTP